MGAVMRLGWSNDAPPDGKILEVWYINTIILAYHTPIGWHTAEGERLAGVTNWRFRQ